MTLSTLAGGNSYTEGDNRDTGETQTERPLRPAVTLSTLAGGNSYTEGDNSETQVRHRPRGRSDRP